MQATFVHGNPLFCKYKPGAAVSAGDVVVVGDLACVAHSAIAASAWGNLAVFGGVYAMVAEEAIAVGKRVYWDAVAEEVDEVATNPIFGFCGLHLASSAEHDVINVIHLPYVDIDTDT